MARTKRYPGQVEPRGDAFRIRLCVAGRRHVKTIAAADRKEAEQFACDWYAQLSRKHDREQLGLPGAQSFSELLKLFTEQEVPNLSPGGRKSYADSFAPFHAFFIDRMGDPATEKIRPGHVKEYLAWRRVTGIKCERDAETREIVKVTTSRASVSPHTVARDRRVLHRLFEYAVELEYLEANPVRHVAAPKTDPHTPSILTPAEYDRLLEACGDRDMLRVYILVLGETGARCESEALQLRWEDVDVAGGFLQIRSGRDGHRTKSGKSRWTPLTPRLADALRDHAARYRLAIYHGARTPWVFHHTNTSRSARAGARIKRMRHGFDNAIERAGLPEMRQHDLRHRRVTKWLAEGANPVLVKEAVGHASLATTMGYTHMAKEHLRALVELPTAVPTAAAKAGA